jgi:hypothetical protein
MTSLRLLAPFAFGLLVVACGGSAKKAFSDTQGDTKPDSGVPFLSTSDAGPDASTAADTGMTPDDAAADISPPVEPDASSIDAGSGPPAFPAPQVQSLGGQVLSAPSVVPIYFANDALQAQDDAFVQALPTSTYWASMGPEYGVGAITALPSIVVTDTAPTTIDDTQVAAWLSTYVSTAHPGWPEFSSNTIYTVYYPASTTVTLEGMTSCTGFTGYHFESTTAAGAPFIYAVIVRCANIPGGVDIDNDTETVSHELYEASTDPHPQTAPAWVGMDPDHLIWEQYPLSELGDMCADMPQSYQRLVGNFMVQRMWSNKAAAAGQDPCVPQLAQPYFNAVPELTSSVSVQGSQSLGVVIPVGQTKTVNIHLFASAPTPDWDVELVDLSSGFLGGPTFLSFSPSSFTGNNGDVVSVQVTAVAANASIGGAELALVSYPSGSTASTLTYATMWFGFVQN